jgi:hypothetical protein
MRDFQRIPLVVIVPMLFAVCVGVSSARADILYQQMQSPESTTASSQTLTDFPTFSTYQFDDFVVGETAWTVTRVTIPGFEQGDSTANTAVKLAFVPDHDFSLVGTTYNGTEDDHGNLVFDNLNINLSAATTYWITAWVERSYADGGQWFWYRANEGGEIVGSEEYFHNPGGDYGYGMDPIPGSMVYGFPGDMAFTIEGTSGGG